MITSLYSVKLRPHLGSRPPLTWLHERSSKSSMTPAGSDIDEYYQMLYMQSRAPDDGRKHRPKHVELTRNNKLTYTFALLWLFS